MAVAQPFSPSGWAMSYRTPRWDAGSWCAVAAYAALSSPVLAILVAAELYGVLRWLMFLSWLPLIPATAWRARSVLAGARATLRYGGSRLEEHKVDGIRRRLRHRRVRHDLLLQEMLDRRI